MMYEIEKAELHSEHCNYYYLKYRGRVLFQEFLEDIQHNHRAQVKKNILYASMERFGAALYPKTKYRKIRHPRCGNLYEFKQDDIRIYVMEQKPDIFIILGGFKGTQKSDIEKAAKHAAAYKAQNNMK